MNSSSRFNFLLLGAGGLMTRAVSQRLLELGARPRAVIQSGTAPTALSSLPGLELEVPRKDWRQAMRVQGIESRYEAEVGDLSTWLRRYRADYLLVACWPRRLPEPVLDSARIDAINIHPSLLPAYPGYDPVGDMLRDGHRDFGVTLHRMTQHIDAGPALKHERLDLPADATHQAIETAAARRGAELFVEILHHPPTLAIRR